MPQPNILLVEDNPTLGYALSEYLSLQDFTVDWVDDGHKAEDIFRVKAFDLCILDVMLPKQDGFSLAKKLKQSVPWMPILFLTAKGMKVDKLKGFQLGADDYLVKPIDEEELVARIQAVLRRAQSSLLPEVSDMLGSYHVRWEARQLSRKDESWSLTEKETQLLRMLMEHKNRLLEREKALRALWGKNDYFNRRSMDVHISRLRKYLKEDGDLQINTVRGRGFILEDLS